ncbi:MAG: penicillin-binding protein 1C [Calditrichaeota bacterium]|nr:penicillin-binding protein 1C [Calditrichota bacterium]
MKRYFQSFRTFWGKRTYFRLVLISWVGLLSTFVLLDVFFPLPKSRLNPPASPVVFDNQGHMLHVFLAPDDAWRIRVKIDRISPLLKQAVLAFEDRYFYWHFGINPVSVVRAGLTDLRAGHIVEGGSTITMQVARMMEPKKRTLVSKVIEAFRALQLEVHYSKKQILEFYFNLAPYGGNIVGVGAASTLYFNKSPDHLSLGEAALLAAIPNSPTRFRPDLHPEEARLARQRVVSILMRNHVFNAKKLKESLEEPIPRKRFSPPLKIPHLANWLIQHIPGHESYFTTVDTRIQHLAEAALKNDLTPLRAKGISNGAVVIIDNHTHAVRALVGSYDFNDGCHQGQVNGATAPRSPGSTLKPFIYTLAFDRGIISPKRALFDIPVNYSGYRPVNYDEMYHGVVTAEDALIRSLNVPAVKLYARMWGNGLYTFLKKAGVSTLRQNDLYYGLSLALGGCDISLIELTSLYSGLASGGEFYSYRLLKDQKIGPGRRLLSRGACFLTAEILSQLHRPDLPAVWESAPGLPKIAWKTGTSYGHKDAWSIGFTPDFTVGVWVGNFDGTGVPELVGAEAAAPIMFSIFQSLQSIKESRWFVRPKSVKRRRVCAVSGMVPTGNCDATVEELYLPGISPNDPCSVHRKILIDQKTHTRLCSFCKAGRTYTERVVEIWPPRVSSWLKKNGYPVDKIPEHFPGCSHLENENRPVIQSPIAKADYFIRPRADIRFQKILLKASVASDARKVFWFLDGRLIWSGKPFTRKFISPEPGTHKIICMDDEGRASEVEFRVRER